MIGQKRWNNDGTKFPSMVIDNDSKLTGHSSVVWSVTWIPDGVMLSSGSEDKTNGFYYEQINRGAKEMQ